MVGGDYTAHSTPGETRHSPQSRSRVRRHIHARRDIRVTLILAFMYRLQTSTDTLSYVNPAARARVLNYAHVVRQWLDVYYIYACSSVSRGPDVPLFSLLFSRQLSFLLFASLSLSLSFAFLFLALSACKAFSFVLPR